MESGDTWVRKFSAEVAQTLTRTGQFELLDYESLKIGLAREDGIGSVVLISGGILAYDYDEEDTGKDDEKKGKKTNKKTGSGKYSRKGTARVEVRLRIVDVSTSRILVTRNFAERETIRKSGKSSDKARIDSADRRRLFAACREEIVRSLERMIVPYIERVYVSFETDKEMPELERSFRRVQAGNWDAALDVFQAATETYSDSPEVHKAYYNLGMSCMYTDRFDQARAALREAYGRKQSAKYRSAILELNKRVEDKRRLEEQARGDPETDEEDTQTGEEQYGPRPAVEK